MIVSQKQTRYMVFIALGCTVLLHMALTTVLSVSEPGHFILDQDMLKSFVFDQQQKHWFSFIEAYLHNRLHSIFCGNMVGFHSHQRMMVMEFKMKANLAPGGKTLTVHSKQIFFISTFKRSIR